MSNKSIHIGARALDSATVINTIPNITNLMSTINGFRKNAYFYSIENNNYLDNDIKENNKEQYDNVVSILGNRGIGKTSTMLTIIRELKEGTYFNESVDKKNNVIDVFSPLIAPEDMSENSDILGWIIISLHDIYSNIKEKELTYVQEELFKQLEKDFIKLKKDYQYRKPETNIVVNDSYNSTSDFVSRKIKIEDGDFKLVPLFQRIIDSLIKLLKIRNRFKYSINNETVDGTPLIFFFFDDVDVATKHSISILRDILTFLSHPNIVVFISGDYKVFSQSATLNMLAQENLSYEEINQSYIYGSDDNCDYAINLAKSRSEFFLRKVMPPMYRYELKKLSNEDKVKIKYTVGENEYTIIQLISKIFELADDNNFFYITNQPFIKDSDTDNNENDLSKKLKKIIEAASPSSEQKKYYIVYPYLSIFSTSARGFINVYNYLYNLIDKPIRWDLTDLADLLDIIMNSKSTFLRYQNEIHKYLRFNKNIYTENGSRDGTNLIIDCEELRLFVQKLPRPEKLSELRDYEALIILPMFFNELGNIVLSKDKDNYKMRYKSVQYKLTELFLNQFMAKINTDLNLLPENESIKMILSFYHRITSRMSITALNNIITNKDSSNINKNESNIRNDKKYFVQLFRSYLYLYEVIYFDIDDKETYIYWDNKLYNINTLDILNNINIDELKAKKLSEQVYRDAIINDYKKREKYEKILSIYVYFHLKKTNAAWISNLYLHAKSCMMSFDKNDMNYGLYPFECFYNSTIFPIVENLRNILRNEKNVIRELEHHIIKLNEIINVENVVIISNNRKTIIQIYNLLVDNLRVEQLDERAFDVDENSGNDSISENIKNIYNTNSKLNTSDNLTNVPVEKIINLINKHDRRKEGTRNINNESNLEMNEYNVVINIFNSIKRQIIFDNSVYNSLEIYNISLEINEILYIFTNNFINEDDLINQVGLVFGDYDENVIESFIEFISKELEKYNNEKNENEKCIESIDRLIMRETRKYRLVSFGISREARKRYAILLAKMLPIYILAIYLSASYNINENVQRDHMFFYQIHSIRKKYE